MLPHLRGQNPSSRQVPSYLGSTPAPGPVSPLEQLPPVVDHCVGAVGTGSERVGRGNGAGKDQRATSDAHLPPGWPCAAQRPKPPGSTAFLPLQALPWSCSVVLGALLPWGWEGKTGRIQIQASRDTTHRRGPGGGRCWLPEPHRQ